MARNFLRQDFMRHIKLGKHRKKLQKWRRPKGRHSKMRNKRKGYPVSPGAGYKKSRNERGKILRLYPKLVTNIKDLTGADKDNIIIIASRVGARKRIELIKKAEEMKLKILNIKERIKNES